MQNVVSSDYLVSIIIPAYNEEKYIAGCLQSIVNVNDKRPYDMEIIVIDNGSTDKTAVIASKFTDRVYTSDKENVSTARNYGASLAKGDLFVFLDADVRLTDQWGIALTQNINNIINKAILTGARYFVRDDPSWLEANWFEPLSKKPVDYINGGNILLSRKSFSQIGGFDELLETGEDYEFSVRAKKNNVDVVLNPQFVVMHDGYPSNIKDFVRREIWHGKGDFLNLKTFFKSKVAISAAIFGILHFALLLSLFIFRLDLSAGIILLILSITLFMSYRIFRTSGLDKIIKNFPLCYLYLMARFISLFIVLKAKM